MIKQNLCVNKEFHEFQQAAIAAQDSLVFPDSAMNG